MEKEIILKVKEKKEFSQLPDGLVEKALVAGKGDVKQARAILRKYFGVFLTNRVLKPKSLDEGILKSHISTRNRDYLEIYKRIFDSEKIKTIVDLGCGVNGFSYKFIVDVFGGGVNYIGVESVGQLVNLMNNYFRDRGFQRAYVFHKDLFDLDFVIDILKKLKGEEEKPRIVFLFNVIDALEFFERNFSKKLISEVSEECEKIVLSFPVQSLSGKTKFKSKRYWILSFLEERFKILDDFELSGERFIVFTGKKEV